MPPLTWKNAKVQSARSLYPKKRKVPKRNAPSTLKKREVSNGKAPLPRKKTPQNSKVQCPLYPEKNPKDNDPSNPSPPKKP